ncbi:MAG: hypothetical protein EBR82_63845 [Caulobacteraceae bacterium]|nr:hypothetical protein [Caulobacteraceae bacterium]
MNAKITHLTNRLDSLAEGFHPMAVATQLALQLKTRAAFLPNLKSPNGEKRSPVRLITISRWTSFWITLKFLGLVSLCDAQPTVTLIQRASQHAAT